MGHAILMSIGVLIGALFFAFGLMGSGNEILIGIAFVIFALSAIYGAQPGWPRRRVD